MRAARAYDNLFKLINKQLEPHQIIVKKGASVVDSPLKPKEKTIHKVTHDREDLEEIEVKKEYADSVDKEASWLKKRELKNYVLKKAKKGTPLKESEKRFNKLVGKVRFKVERTFGGIKSWFKGGTA